MALESIDEQKTSSGVFLTPGIVDIPYDMRLVVSEIIERLTRIEQEIVQRNIPVPKIPEELVDKKPLQGGIQSLTRGPLGHIESIKKHT